MDVPSAVPVLETPRLRLRPFALSDAPAVEELAGAPEVARLTLNIPHPYPPGLATSWIESHAPAAERGERLTWAIERRSDAEFLGAITLTLTLDHQRGELGYWIGLPYWGQGFATEAAQQVTTYGFADLALHRMQARCLPRSRASSRLIEKAGLQYEGTLRGYMRVKSASEDIAVYARLQTDAS